MDTNICLYCEKLLAIPNASFCSRTCYAREAASKQAPVWATPPGLSSTRIQRAVLREESFTVLGSCRRSPSPAKANPVPKEGSRSGSSQRLVRSLSSPGSSSFLSPSYVSSGRTTPENEDDDDDHGSWMVSSVSLSHPKSTFLQRKEEQQQQQQPELKRHIRPS